MSGPNVNTWVRDNSNLDGHVELSTASEKEQFPSEIQFADAVHNPFIVRFVTPAVGDRAMQTPSAVTTNIFWCDLHLKSLVAAAYEPSTSPTHNTGPFKSLRPSEVRSRSSTACEPPCNVYSLQVVDIGIKAANSGS